MIAFSNMTDNPHNVSKFNLIYETYKNTMYSVAYDVVKHPYDAEDIVQQSLIKVIEILHRIDYEDIPTQKCKNLIIIITKNTGIDFLRKSTHTPYPLETVDHYTQCKSTEELYIETSDYEHLIKSISSLDEKHKEILRLRILYHLSSKEIARILNITEYNVNTRYMRAKKALRDKLKGV